MFDPLEGSDGGVSNGLSTMFAVELLQNPDRWPLSRMPVKREIEAVDHFGIDYEFGTLFESGGDVAPVVFGRPDGCFVYGTMTGLVMDGWRPE